MRNAWAWLVALAAAVIHSLFSIQNATRFISQNLGTVDIDNTDTYHKRFATIVSEVNVATGNKYKIKPVVIPTVAMNAFAISDNKKNAVLGVTEGLLSKLNRQQLQAVVAHEVGHIVSGDSFQTTIGCSLFGIYSAMLRALKKIFSGGGRHYRSSGRGGGGIILFLFVIYLVLSLMQFFYGMIRMALSRDRELRADALAVRMTRDPLSLSEALYAISRGWRGIGNIDENLEALFIINPAKNAVDEKEGAWADMMSTHPPIKKRINVLAKLAHDEIRNVQEKILSQEKLKESMREVPADKKQPRWMLLDKQQKWQGPFTVIQMMTLGLVTPLTTMKALDRDVISLAKDEPLLRPLFDDRAKGLSRSSCDCPKCSHALIEEEYEGTVVQRCVFCDGVLLEKDKMPLGGFWMIFRYKKAISLISLLPGE